MSILKERPIGIGLYGFFTTGSPLVASQAVIKKNTNKLWFPYQKLRRIAGECGYWRGIHTQYKLNYHGLKKPSIITLRFTISSLITCQHTWLLLFRRLLLGQVITGDAEEVKHRHPAVDVDHQIQAVELYLCLLGHLTKN